MTFNDIIADINHKVENSAFEKFTLAQVITELNNTYRDLANKTDIFETFDYLQLVDNRVNYTLPDAIHEATRGVFRGRKTDFKSQEEMDIDIPTWEGHTTESALTCIVYNNLSDRKVKVYPRLINVTVTAEADIISYIGELVESHDPINRYLFVNNNTGAKYLAPATNSLPSAMIEVVTIYGTHLPPKVTADDLDSTRIYIDEININALIYGTAGNLLFISGRTEDMVKGSNFMKIYGLDESEVASIRKKKVTGGVKNTTRNSGYRTPFKN